MVCRCARVNVSFCLGIQNTSQLGFPNLVFVDGPHGIDRVAGDEKQTNNNKKNPVQNVIKQLKVVCVYK